MAQDVHAEGWRARRAGGALVVVDVGGLDAVGDCGTGRRRAVTLAAAAPAIEHG